MEQLARAIDELLSLLPNEQDVRTRLDSLVSIYPFNEYEYIISNLLAADILTLDAYHELRDDYAARIGTCICMCLRSVHLAHLVSRGPKVS